MIKIDLNPLEVFSYRNIIFHETSRIEKKKSMKEKSFLTFLNVKIIFQTLKHEFFLSNGNLLQFIALKNDMWQMNCEKDFYIFA